MSLEFPKSKIMCRALTLCDGGLVGLDSVASGQSLVAQGTVWISNGVVSSCWILVLKDVAVGAWSSRTLDSLNLMGLDI